METSPQQLPVFRLSVTRSFKSVFDSENWVVNLLWLTLANLTSSIFVGSIGILGWGSELIKLRAGRPENRTPDIDSERLGDYFSQGLWPFVVQFAAGILMTVLMAIPFVPILGVLVALAGNSAGEEVVGIFLLAIAAPIAVVLIVVSSLVTAVLIIRAMACQDFVTSFDFAWVRNFVRLMWKDMVVAGIKFAGLSLLVSLAGTLLFCIGSIPAGGVVFGAGMHLLAQIYELYLAKGGEPAPAPPEQNILEATLA